MISPQRITTRQATIGVMGLGYVGLPLAMAFAEAGFPVWGVDTDSEKVKRVRSGHSPIPDIPSSVILAQVNARRLRVTTAPHILRSCDVLIICVPTPLRKTRDPDVSYIAHASETIAHMLHPGQLVILESTTYPGTTREFVLPRLAARGLTVGRDFFLAFSPERIDPGNSQYGLSNTPKVVAGVTRRCLMLATMLYSTITKEVVPVSSTETAEMVKLLENTFRAVNIGLANEVALMCHRLGINVWEVIEAAATKPFGFMPFYPGPGIGGHCIPLDPQYLAWKMKALNFEPRFIELASAINAMMPEYIVRRIGDALNDRRMPLKGSQILILGVAYKPNVADIRESPALDVMTLLLRRGVHLFYNDPYVPTLSLEGRQLHSTRITPSLLRKLDACVITTAHRNYDYAHLVKGCPLLIDTRNATRNLTSPHLVKL